MAWKIRIRPKRVYTLIKQPLIANPRFGIGQSYFMDELVAVNQFPATALQTIAEAPRTTRLQKFTSVSFPLENKINRFIKRSIDLVIAIVLGITLLPWLVPILAIIIMLDSRGPVFFMQKRNREKGKIFTCIKFRTMIPNEHADMLASGINDQRVTRFGKFLRRHHIDELPQLINVLKGEMSVIGPRPFMVSENLFYDHLLDGYSLRHAVKPGITGLAQSFGYFGSFHDLQKVKERLSLDTRYIEQWSLSMDMKILWRTVLLSFNINNKN